MAFQIKNFTSIVASMINHARVTTKKITDWNPGSVARTMVEAPAIEISELYQQMFNGLREAIPVAIYNSFNFSLLPAVAANGYVRVSISPQSADQVIGAGTIFSAAGASVTYVSQADVTIAAGSSYGDVFVAATTAGSIGNIPAGSTFTLSVPPAGFSSASNAVAFVNGRDAETETQRQSRFAAFIASMSRGTPGALEYGAKTAQLTDANGVITEQVIYAKVIEPYLTDSTQPIAYVQVYVHNGSTGASSALLTQATKVLNGYYKGVTPVPGWKAAGIKMDVYAASNLALNVTGTVTVSAGYQASSVIAAATSAINSYLSGLGIGESALVAEIVTLVMSVPGVDNVALTAPTGDTAATSIQKLVAGTITLTAA